LELGLAQHLSPRLELGEGVGLDWRSQRGEETIGKERGRRFGAANGEPMSFSFPELVAHAARTRHLVAGTIIGSGTVSNTDASRGWSCIAEVRALEMIESGAARTEFMKFGDTIRIEMIGSDGQSVFGAIPCALWPRGTAVRPRLGGA
jgi:fumarylacetoacetate (FAA) hydrolase